MFQFKIVEVSTSMSQYTPCVVVEMNFLIKFSHQVEELLFNRE